MGNQEPSMEERHTTHGNGKKNITQKLRIEQHEPRQKPRDLRCSGSVLVPHVTFGLPLHT